MEAVMARVQIEEILDHLSSEFRGALEDAVHQEISGAQFDSYSLFRTFRNAVARKCNIWEQVPDAYIEKS